MPSHTSIQEKKHITTQRVVLTVLACLGMTALATPLIGRLDLANIVMLFLLTVLVVAVRLGRNAAILASVLSVLCFDIFFVPPRFSLAVNDLQYLVTFAVMLITALTASHLTSTLRERAQQATEREQRAQALYQLAKQLSAALTVAQVMEIADSFLRSQFKAQAAVLVSDDEDHTLKPLHPESRFPIEPHLARIAFDQGKFVKSSEVSAMGYAELYFPLKASMRVRGVMAIAFESKLADRDAEPLALLDALSLLVAEALERLHYVEVAQQSDMRMLTERLRNSILSALSHDLRTPLTAMVGLADSLFLIKPALPAAALETAHALHEQATRLTGLMENLLDMARLNAGKVTLRREWQPLEEVVGASIKLLGPALADHPVKVNLPPDLPLLAFDAVLLERVLCNLLENAAKHSPAHAPIELEAKPIGSMVQVSVMDHGPGFPNGREQALFEMFVRGHSESDKSGVGLGLSICKTIVEAHGGTIEARHRPEGGAVVSFTLPVGHPPILEEEPV